VKEDATEIIQAAYRHFVAGGNEKESPEDQARAVIDWILDRERGRHRVGDDPVAAYKVNRLTLFRLQQTLLMDSDDPRMFALEKFLRRVLEGRGPDAVALVERIVEERSEKMGGVASKGWETRTARKKTAPTPLDRFNDRLEQIVREKPDITSGELKKKVELLQGGDLVECVTDEGEIRLKGYEGRHPKMSGIANRMTRIKEKNR
jgi:hypothetical protein